MVQVREPRWKDMISERRLVRRRNFHVKMGNIFFLISDMLHRRNPEVVIYVVIDEANVDAQDNSSLVLELAKNIMSEAFPYLGITTIEETGESQTQQSGQSFEDTEYSDYDQDYTDHYSNEDGSYVDENYKPDLDSWATSSNID